MYNPIGKFPNNIFIPKIVPLVYDDTLSYYEFLCKVLNKLNEAIETLNLLGEKVDVLEEAVRQIQLKINEFEERISQNEADITYLKGVVVDLNNAINSINTAITNLENQVEDNTTNIGLINTSISTINSTIADIQDAIASLDIIPVQITQIEGDITSLDTRVTNLEGTAFGSVTPNPTNMLYISDFRPGGNIYTDWDIVVVEDNGGDNDIYVDENGYIAFYNNGVDSNVCALRLKNVITDISPFINLDSVQLNFAFLFVRAGYIEKSYSNGVTLSVLTSNGGFTGNEYFPKIYLRPSTSKNYDLYIQGSPLSTYLIRQIGHLFISTGVIPLNDEVIKGFIGNSTQSLGGTIRKNCKNYDEDIADINTNIDTLGMQVTNNATAISNEASARQGADTVFNSRINALNTIVNALDSDINSLETVNTWYNFSDVFENGNFPPNAHIHYFKCQKVNKVVTMEIAGRGFITDNDFRFSTFYLGKLRDGVKNILAPKDGKEVTCFGVSEETNNSGQNIAVTGASADPNRSPLILAGNTLAIGVLTGSETANPWTWANYTEAVLKPYSLMVNTNASFSDNMHSAFVIRFTYVTN